MRYPDFLREQGCIGFVAPSFGCVTEPYHAAFERAQQVLRNRGFRTLLGPNCYASDGVGKSSTPENCGREINEMYCSSETDILISCGGGETMCEDLPHIDFERLRAAKPKWFMGYSDNTNLTFLLTTLCDVASVYGPNAPAFGMEPWHPAITDAWLLLTGKKQTMRSYEGWERQSKKDVLHPYEPYHITEPSALHTYPTAQAELSGRLIGGCLDCLAGLVGTRFDHVAEFLERYREDGFLWFLEACDLNTMGMRRALWQLDQAGWFRYCRGFLIGRPWLYEDASMGLDHTEAVTGILGKYGVPIVLDADLGHLPPAMPLICGSVAKGKVQGTSLHLSMELRS